MVTVRTVPKHHASLQIKSQPSITALVKHQVQTQTVNNDIELQQQNLAKIPTCQFIWSRPTQNVFV